METQQQTDIEEIIPAADEMTNEIALLPEQEQKDIQKAAAPADLKLIGTHKQKVTSFKKRFPISKFTFEEGEAFDKEKHGKALEAWREIKNYRTKNIVTDFKTLKAPLQTVLNYYNEMQNKLLADIKKVEDPIGEVVDRMEAQKKIEDEKEQREQEYRTNRRVNEILQAGASFDGSFYSVGSVEFEIEPISLGQSDINSMTEELYSKVLSEIVSKAATIKEKQDAKDAEALRVEQERKDKEEADRKLFQQQQDDLKKQQEALKLQNAKIRARELKSLGFVLNEDKQIYYSNSVAITVTEVESLEMGAWDAWVTEAEERIESAETNAKKERMVAERKTTLLNMGLIENNHGYTSVYKHLKADVSFYTVESYNDSEWANMLLEISEITTSIVTEKVSDQLAEQRKKELIHSRESLLSPYWQYVTPLEKSTLGDIEEVAFTELLSDKKTISDKKIADELLLQKERKEKADRDALAQQGDEAMYLDFLVRLKQVEVPIVTTDEYKSKISHVKNFLFDL